MFTVCLEAFSTAEAVSLASIAHAASRGSMDITLRLQGSFFDVKLDEAELNHLE